MAAWLSPSRTTLAVPFSCVPPAAAFPDWVKRAKRAGCPGLLEGVGVFQKDSKRHAKPPESAHHRDIGLRGRHGNSCQQRASDEFQRTKSGESLWRPLDGASYRLEVACVVMHQRYPGHQRCRRDKSVEPPASESFLPRLRQPVGKARWG